MTMDPSRCQKVLEARQTAVIAFLMKERRERQTLFEVDHRSSGRRKDAEDSRVGTVTSLSS
jgi:hypothetical protein